MWDSASSVFFFLRCVRIAVTYCVGVSTAFYGFGMSKVESGFRI